MIERAQKKSLQQDLKKKYVFLAGPRQSGKTTLSKQLSPKNVFEYYNYDSSEDRQVIRKGEWSRDVRLVILDEIHKLEKWKSFLKGYYDTEGIPPSILASGSARMNVFKKGNDSMAGRYFYHRLLGLSVKELETQYSSEAALEALLKYGNFPEPFLEASLKASKRWREAYLDTVIREDLVDLSNVRKIKKIQLLVDLLRERVGSQISYASIAQDIEVAPKTVKEWIEILEELYLIFRVTPYSKKIARSILKEPKIYFYDSSMAFNSESHLENLVAVSLLKHLYFIEDNEGSRCSLHYLRNKNGHEVDFLTCIDKKPQKMIEVKNSDNTLHKGLLTFQAQINECKSVQIVRKLRKKKTVHGVKMTSVHEFLSGLKN